MLNGRLQKIRPCNVSVAIDASVLDRWTNEELNIY